MKRTLILIAVVAVLAAGISYSMVRWMAARSAAQPHNTAWLKRELQLTPAQARAVETAESQFRNHLNAICATHCEARFALGDELAKPQPETAACRQHVTKMGAAQADAERLTLEHILKVRALLNDEQARRYSALIRDQVCNMPMGAP